MTTAWGLAAALALAAARPDSLRPPPPVDSAAVAARGGAGAGAADPWIGTDKVKHFVLAGFAESVAFAAARTAGAARRPALAVGAAVGLAVSVGKELADRGGRGQPSVRDLAWDAAGIAAYAVLLARTPR